MFEFGRDLKKLFERARESDDLGWIELITAPMVAAEARREAIDAGRVSCARPVAAGLRASMLWREHARRTGARDSLDQATRAASDAARLADTADAQATAALEAAEIHLLAFDLFGGPERLRAAAFTVQAIRADRGALRAAAGSLVARLSARQAWLSEDAARQTLALAGLDAALAHEHLLPVVAADDLRLEREALAVELGVTRRDAALLDQAGRGLRGLVERAAPEYRPLTRARALALAGTGLSALATLAHDAVAAASGQALFEAAADQFTADHSPLDWVAVQLARPRGDAALMPLAQCEALAREPGLILGAMAAERRVAAEAALAEAMGDVYSLDGLIAVIHRRLAGGGLTPIAWAADQIGMAHLHAARARVTGQAPVGLGLMLSEAAQTAREQGALGLESRARVLLKITAA